PEDAGLLHRHRRDDLRREGRRGEPILHLFDPQPRPALAGVPWRVRPADAVHPTVEELGKGFVRHGCASYSGPQMFTAITGRPAARAASYRFIAVNIWGPE